MRQYKPKDNDEYWVVYKRRVTNKREANCRKKAKTRLRRRFRRLKEIE